MGLGIRRFIIKQMRKSGFDIVKYPNEDLERRLFIIKYCKINKLFDIGGNKGQYALLMRELGLDMNIVSFEPLSSAFEVLQKISQKDKNWIVNNYALGNENKVSKINIAANSESSSILDMLPSHFKSAPYSKYIDTETIEIKKLDSVFDSFYQSEDKTMLKIDTQGYEKLILDGAEKSLEKISLIQLEMSTIPLYNKETLYLEMINFLSEKNFELFALETNFINPKSGKLLQLDGLFVNSNLVENPD
ncbi:MAG: FkbM family methyltransferase [Bacteroidota bacterium]|nr:FkbM family methyltransferase [Bacteroidota bacterium]